MVYDMSEEIDRAIWEAKVSSTGYSLVVFIPKYIASVLGLKRGDKVIVIIQKKKEVREK